MAEPPPAPVAETPRPPSAEPAPAGERQAPRWPLLGILLPAAIFLSATWITAGLYRHFSHAGH